MTANSIAEAFADAAARLIGRSDVAGSLVALLVDCVALTDADSAGLLVTTPDDGLALLSSTSHNTSVLELYELQNGRGPCIQAIEDNKAVSALEPELSQQWKPVGHAIVAAGYHAVHAFPLRWHGRAVGALNLFAADARRLNRDEQQLGQAFANMAVAALAQPAAADWSAVHGQILDVLADRATIEQAKGVLAVQNDIGLSEAYQLLITDAARHRTPLADHAGHVVASVRPRNLR